FKAEDGIRDDLVTGVQTCALPICFSEGLQLMVPGETRRLWIPEGLAYKGQANRPKGMLVFDVTLIGMPNRPPSDVKAPPPDAKRSEERRVGKEWRTRRSARRS